MRRVVRLALAITALLALQGCIAAQTVGVAAGVAGATIGVAGDVAEGAVNVVTPGGDDDDGDDE